MEFTKRKGKYSYLADYLSTNNNNSSAIGDFAKQVRMCTVNNYLRNLDVFCLMQLNTTEAEGKFELCTKGIKVYIYGLKLGRKDLYNVFDKCCYKDKYTILRREYVSKNGVADIYI